MKHQRGSTRGFALVLVLSLLSILVILALAISSASKVDSQISTSAKYQTQAKGNALTAIRVALGKLQSSAGRTDRLTGMAGIVGIPVSADSPTRYWTGVWETDGDSVGFLTWLVSGNSPPTTLGADSVLLVGKNSVGDEADTNATPTISREKEWVRVPRTEIVLQNGDPNGHIAYWVGDEGIKVSSYVPIDEQPNTNGSPIVSDKLNATQQGLWNAVTELSSLQLAHFISYEQLTYSGAKPSYVKEAFHYVTLRSRFLEGSGFISGRVNINTASRPLWFSLVSSYNAMTLGKQLQVASTGRKIADAMVSGPFATVNSFAKSELLENALPSTVSAVEFVQTLDGILTTRSDTFRIRAYGDAMNPADGGASGAPPESVAYCEAIVQRTNAPDPSGNGKKFVITYFRWLGPDDI